MAASHNEIHQPRIAENLQIYRNSNIDYHDWFRLLNTKIFDIQQFLVGTKSKLVGLNLFRLNRTSRLGHHIVVLSLRCLTVTEILRLFILFLVLF